MYIFNNSVSIYDVFLNIYTFKYIETSIYCMVTVVKWLIQEHISEGSSHFKQDYGISPQRMDNVIIYRPWTQISQSLNASLLPPGEPRPAAEGLRQEVGIHFHASRGASQVSGNTDVNQKNTTLWPRYQPGRTHVGELWVGRMRVDQIRLVHIRVFTWHTHTITRTHSNLCLHAWFEYYFPMGEQNGLVCSVSWALGQCCSHKQCIASVPCFCLQNHMH